MKPYKQIGKHIAKVGITGSKKNLLTQKQYLNPKDMYWLSFIIA